MEKVSHMHAVDSPSRSTRIARLTRLAALLGICTGALLAAGCVALRSANRPMYTVAEPSACIAHADTLLVMLPGAYSNLDEFVREGFIAAVQQNRLAVDVLRVEAHLGYYEKNSFVERLHEDVIAPAQARGYRAIWIAGISIGGFGGLIYAQERPGELAGVVALAPYLGEPAVAREVAGAGGLLRWTPSATPEATPRRANEIRLWQSLKGYADPAASRLPPLYLGYGTADRFATSNGLLADVLPAGRIFRTEGGHDWAPWRRLWLAMLPTLPLPHCAS